MYDRVDSRYIIIVIALFANPMHIHNIQLIYNNKQQSHIDVSGFLCCFSFWRIQPQLVRSVKTKSIEEQKVKKSCVHKTPPYVLHVYASQSDLWCRTIQLFEKLSNTKIGFSRHNTNLNSTFFSLLFVAFYLAHILLTWCNKNSIMLWLSYKIFNFFARCMSEHGRQRQKKE